MRVFTNLKSFRIFAKEREEINAYKQRMDKVIQASVKEALIQVGLMNVQNGGNIKQTLNLVG